MSFSNDAQSKQAIKGHTCLCCERTIHPTEQYTEVKYIENKKFSTLKLCLVCSFLQTLKEGPNQGKIVPGEFTERKIPGCLRRVKQEFYDNMLACMKKYGKDVEPEKKPKEPIKTVVVKASIFNNKIIHVPVTKQYTLDRFIVGSEITLSAGVKGPQKKVTIKSVSEVDGESFGREGKCLAILLEK